MFNNTQAPEVSVVDFLHPDTIDELTLQQARPIVNSFVKESVQPIPHDSRFDFENISKLQDHKWMQKCDFQLIYADDLEEPKEVLDNLLEQLKEEAIYEDAKIKEKEAKPLIAVDLEATSLNNRIRKYGGAIVKENEIVGVCLATSDTKAYYLPVKHNELDGIPNFDEALIKEFLTQLEEEFFTIYHNSNYDRELLHISGVRLGKSYADTMLLAINLGLRDKYRQVGLKFLAQKELERTMIEIHEMFGKKNHIQFNRLTAKSAYVYGCSDAANTFGLFKRFVLDNEENNPYEVNGLAMILDARAADKSRTMFRYGMPTDYPKARNNLKTVLRRKNIIMNKYYSLVPESVPISSNEKIGIYIGEILFSSFKKEFKDKFNSEEKLIEKFTDTIYKHFSMERKTRKLKNSVKITYNSSDDVLTGIISNIENVKWVEDQMKEKLVSIAKLIKDYRQLVHEEGILQKLVRFSQNDDYGITRVGVQLKFNGTDTTRYSNQGSKLGAVSRAVKSGKSYKYIQGDGVAGFNAQGIPSDAIYLKKAKRLIKLPKELEEYKFQIDREMEVSYKETLLGV